MFHKHSSLKSLNTIVMIPNNVAPNTLKTQALKIGFAIFCSNLFLSLIAHAQSKHPDGRRSDDVDTWNWNVPDTMEHVTHEVVYSRSMERDVGYNIYLPPSYLSDQNKRFSVVYWLHGAGGDEKSSAYMMDIILPEIESGSIEEAIFVFVNGGHWSSYRDSNTSYVKSETHIVKELIPEIDKRYRTITSRNGRAIFGYSMGGGGSVRLALKYPELFCGAGSFSGALNYGRDRETGKRSTAQKVYSEDNVFYHATKNQELIRDKIGLFLTVGGSEWLYDNHPAFIDHLHALDIKFNYIVRGDLTHNLGTSKELFGSQMMRFLDSCYSAPFTE